MSVAGRFADHVNVAVQHKTHRPMEHVQSYIRGHWTLPPRVHLCRIAPATAMVIDAGDKQTNTLPKYNF